MSHKPQGFVFALVCCVCCFILFFPSGQAETPIRSAATRAGASQVLISWEAVTGKSYALKTTTSLLSPWEPLETQPAVLQAQTNTLSYTVPIETGARFFRVVKLDTEPPQLERLSPVHGAIAVGRQEALEVLMEDETGVDPASITLTVGAQPPATLADARLTYTNRVLTYRPGAGESYGGYGERVAVKLSVADTLGNRLSDHPWSFELEQKTTLVDGIRLIGQPGVSRLHTAGTTDLTLLSVNGSLYTYKYSGDSANLSAGEYLVDSSYNSGYILRVQQALEDPSTHTVVVLGRLASLAELVAERGSVRFRDLREAGSGVTLHGGEVGGDLSLPVEFSLDGTVLYEDAQAGIKVEITEGVVEIVPSLEAGATFREFTPEQIQIDLSGTVRMKVVVRASGQGGKTRSGSWPLMKPKRYFKGALIGWVPVWIEAVVRVDLGYEVELGASGYAQAGVDVKERFGYQVRYADKRWTSGPTRSHELTWFPPEWQIAGDFRVRGSVEPRVEVYVYSLAGGEAGLSPYLELAGDWQLNPVEVNWGLWWGIPGHIGVSARIWDPEWGELPRWDFDLVSRTLITQGTYRGPVITRSSRDQTVVAGQTVRFSVEADGPRLLYQWQKDGVDLADSARISGARSAWLTIGQAQPSDAGAYRVQVSNGVGAATSEAARLAVQGGEPPVIPGTVFIPAGSFTMGSPNTEQDRDSDEGPQTQVTLTHGFLMSRYEVTQREYQTVVGSNPSYFQGDANRPVEQVSWHDAMNYCGRLTAQEQAAGRLPAGWAYRLPTEAEWEYACRAGTTTRFSYGDDPGYSLLGNYAWYASNSGNTTHPVGGKQPNALGLYDMAGNVWEWCLDWYGPYPGGSVTDPKGPATGSARVMRGNSWGRHRTGDCRSADRYYSDTGSLYLGFRVVLAPSP